MEEQFILTDAEEAALVAQAELEAEFAGTQYCLMGLEQFECGGGF